MEENIIPIKNTTHHSPTAYDRAYLASVLRTFAQIQLICGTSDTLGTLTNIKFFILIFGSPYNFFHAGANFHLRYTSFFGKNYTIRLLFVLQCLEIKLRSRVGLERNAVDAEVFLFWLHQKYTGVVCYYENCNPHF